MNRKTQMTSEIPLASSDADDMRPPSADRGGIGGHKGSATSQELAEQFGVSSSTLERVRRGNKENNGSNSGADADVQPRRHRILLKYGLYSGGAYTSRPTAQFGLSAAIT
jgi:hypothetical protein